MLWLSCNLLLRQFIASLAWTLSSLLAVLPRKRGKWKEDLEIFLMSSEKAFCHRSGLKEEGRLYPSNPARVDPYYLSPYMVVILLMWSTTRRYDAMLMPYIPWLATLNLIHCREDRDHGEKISQFASSFVSSSALSFIHLHYTSITITYTYSAGPSNNKQQAG